MADGPIKGLPDNISTHQCRSQVLAIFLRRPSIGCAVPPRALLSWFTIYCMQFGELGVSCEPGKMWCKSVCVHRGRLS